MRERRQPEGCKQSVYFPEEMLDEVAVHAQRLERSLSWVVVQCVKRGGLEHLRSLPGIDDVEAAE
ncbi:MAG TPA: TIGR04563 family protein [Pyrinomonadaceae bacterium]|nr:TIGR04563 family protein [Pyrinomonadaceae bacterium]